MVWEEAQLVQDRENRHLATTASLFQMALSTQPNMALKKGIDKKAVANFRKSVDALMKG